MYRLIGCFLRTPDHNLPASNRRILGFTQSLGVLRDFKSTVPSNAYPPLHEGTIEFLHVLIGSIPKSGGSRTFRVRTPGHLNSETSRLGDSRFPRARREIAASDSVPVGSRINFPRSTPSLCARGRNARQEGDGTRFYRGAWWRRHAEGRSPVGRLGKVFT